MPVAIDTPKLHAVHIDMSVTSSFGIFQPGGASIEGEVCGHHIQVPATDRIRINGCIKCWRRSPVINGNHALGVHGMCASSSLGRHWRIVLCRQQFKTGPDRRCAKKCPADKSHEQAAAL